MYVQSASQLEVIWLLVLDHEHTFVIFSISMTLKALMITTKTCLTLAKLIYQHTNEKSHKMIFKSWWYDVSNLVMASISNITWTWVSVSENMEFQTYGNGYLDVLVVKTLICLLDTLSVSIKTSSDLEKNFTLRSLVT